MPHTGIHFDTIYKLNLKHAVYLCVRNARDGVFDKIQIYFYERPEIIFTYY